MLTLKTSLRLLSVPNQGNTDSEICQWRREPKGRRPCMFLHVPNGLEEEDIRRGREAALGLIVALVASEMAGHRSPRVEDIMEEEEWDRAADDECS